jgi:hypothetical protein
MLGYKSTDVKKLLHQVTKEKENTTAYALSLDLDRENLSQINCSNC